MITYLRVQNFRRHKETELHFDDQAQLILFAGANGNGKTTLAIEAPLYALYGQGRHGKAKLDRLVRRGAELEGMEVELEFKYADQTYRVRRRRDSKVSTAILYANDTAIVEGADSVTAEITKILGMDAAAFKIAGIAQQKELEGITKLKPAERSAMLSRLLRLDVITRARKDARTLLATKKSVIDAMGPGEDIQAHEANILAAQADLESTSLALAECDAFITSLDELIAASADTTDSWNKATAALARAIGNAEALEAELTRQRRALEELVIPPLVSAPEKDIATLISDATQVERELAKAEEAARGNSHAEMIKSELATTERRLDELDQELASTTSDALQADIDNAVAELEDIQEVIKRSKLAQQEARDAETTHATQARTLQLRLETADSLPSTCPTCEQDIPTSHKHELGASLKAQLNEHLTQAGAFSHTARQKAEEITSNEEAYRQGSVRLSKMRADLVTLTRLNGEYNELIRRKNTYTDQLQRITPVVVDIDALYARKGSVTADIASAQAAADALRLREEALSKKEALSKLLTAATTRAAQAREQVTTAAISPELNAAYIAYQKAVADREQELELRSGCQTQVAIAQTTLDAAIKALEVAKTANQGRTKLVQEATVAGNASLILADAETALNRSMRPSLEGGIAQMLSLLSEGRFTQVAVDEDYNIQVGDDGGLQPLEEFSGGELDLIALAVRLALTGVVSERRGTPLGWLILDECFGALDNDRRRTVITALRSLRASIGQIWIISHVSGLEDECDRVIEITDEVDEFHRRIAITE